MKKMVVGLFLVLLFVAGVHTLGFAQFGVGIQAPLAAFGSVTLGPITFEVGVPLQLNLASFGTFAAAKLSIGKLELEDLVLRPFLGVNGNVIFSDLSALNWLTMAGFEIYLEKSDVNLFGQLGFAPDFHTGLLESFVLGVRHDF